MIPIHKKWAYLQVAWLSAWIFKYAMIHSASSSKAGVVGLGLLSCWEGEGEGSVDIVTGGGGFATLEAQGEKKQRFPSRPVWRIVLVFMCKARMKAEAVLDAGAAGRAISDKTKKGALYSPEDRPISADWQSNARACRQQGVEYLEFEFGPECQASQVPGLTGPNRVRLAQIRCDQRPQRSLVYCRGS